MLTELDSRARCDAYRHLPRDGRRSMTARSTSPRDRLSHPKEPSKESSQSLASRVRGGILWSAASTLLLRLANIALTAVVAHILDPRDFGVFAVALTAYSIVSAIGELGVSSCLIRADLNIDFLAPTMAAVSLATSLALAGVMAVFAVPIAGALGSESAASSVRVMALAVFLVGVFAVPSSQLVRDFKQDKLFLANGASFVASTAVLLLLAKSGGGAMAFAWSRVVGQFVAGSVMIVSLPKNYLPGIARGALSVLYRFGLPLAGANFINYILVNTDYALVGHIMGAVALGTYVLAFNVASWPASILSAVIINVSMPAFSRVKHDAGLLKESIANSLRGVSLIVMPMCALTMVLARPLVLTLYGAKWAASAEVLSILSVYGAISVICTLFANIISGLGKTKILLVIQVIWLATLFPAMALGVHEDGIVGAAIAHVVIIVPIVLPCYLIFLRRETEVRMAALAKAVLPALLAALTAALAAEGAVSVFAKPAVQLITGLATGGLIYVFAAVPAALALLNPGQIAKLRARRILRLYNRAARMVGLSVGGPPKHMARGGSRRVRQEPIAIEKGLISVPGQADLAHAVRTQEPPWRDLRADLRPPRGRYTGGRAGLGERVPPQHLAATPPGHRLRARHAAVRRDPPAVAEGPW